MGRVGEFLHLPLRDSRLGLDEGWDGLCSEKETGVSPFPLSTDIVGGEVGSEYSEEGDMAGSVEAWEGAC